MFRGVTGLHANALRSTQEAITRYSGYWCHPTSLHEAIILTKAALSEVMLKLGLPGRVSLVFVVVYSKQVLPR